MQPSANELEQIVRVVMQRLATGRDLMAGVTEMAEPTAEPTELAISDRVVTTSLVAGRLDGKRTLRVGPRAIVTPAVTDLLRAKKIELVRNAQPVSRARALSPSKSPTAASSKLAGGSNPTGDATAAGAAATPATAAPILVCGSAIWFNSLIRHLCPKQAVVEACDDAIALQVVQRHLAQGGRQAVWLSSTPFAAAASAQRGTTAPAVQLPSLSELPAALEQAQPQLFIVDAPRWTVAAIGNLVRSLARIH